MSVEFDPKTGEVIVPTDSTENKDEVKGFEVAPTTENQSNDNPPVNPSESDSKPDEVKPDAVNGGKLTDSEKNEIKAAIDKAIEEAKRRVIEDFKSARVEGTDALKQKITMMAYNSGMDSQQQNRFLTELFRLLGW